LVASRSVIVIVAVVVPSAVTLAGLAATVEVVAETAPITNVTAAVWVMMIVSVVSVAVSVLVPAVVERTVPVVWPAALVTAAGCPIVSVAPREEARLTALPATGLLLASRNVMVIVALATPSAVTVVGVAVTVEVVAETAPAVNVTAAVWVMTMASVVSVAVSVLVPAVLERTVPVVWPAALVAAAGWMIVSVAPREEATVTVLPLTGLLLASRNVIVIVAVVTPSAVTVAGLTVTVEVVAETAPTVHVTLEVGACAASLVLPVVPATPSLTVMVTGPSAS
jgi:hypothetical protein